MTADHSFLDISSNFLNEQANESEAKLTLPRSIDAEQAVLGAILADNELWFEIQSILVEDDFYNISHQSIYQAIVSLINRNTRADSITVAELLNNNKQLEKIKGGRSYLVEMMQNVPAISNVVGYANIIRDKSILRQLYTIGRKISEMAYQEGCGAIDILDEAEKLIFGIAEEHHRRGSTLLPVGQYIPLIEKRIAKLHGKPNNGITGIETGFYDLDKITSGLQAGDLIIIAGRPSMGKTAFAVNIAEHCSLSNQGSVAIFSMEMPAEQLVTRMISSTGEISINQIRSGQFDGRDHYKFQEALNKLLPSRIFIDETAGLSALDIRAKVRRFKRLNPDLSLVIVDYIQLMSGFGKNSNNRVTELGEISRSLKALAKEINIPIIVLSQLSRSVETRQDKRPIMSDLRDSGAIEQDADIIIFMYRAGYYSREEGEKEPVNDPAEAIIRKHRNGALGSIKLFFRGEYSKFMNA